MMRTNKSNKKYLEMSFAEKYFYTKDMTPEEVYKLYCEEKQRFAVEQMKKQQEAERAKREKQKQIKEQKKQEKEQEAEIAKAIEQQVIELLEEEFAKLFK